MRAIERHARNLRQHRHQQNAPDTGEADGQSSDERRGRDGPEHARC